MPFGLVGSKNREVPMANERVEQAMRVRNLTRHYGRVRHAQPATDHGEPTDHIGRRLTELPHMRYNAKKAQVEGERYHTIEYQNALLLEKMRKIMYLGTAASNNGHHETGHPDEVMPRSLNAGSRRRELRKITEQNLGIVHRIQGRASEYERRRWEGERRHTEEILDRIARKPRPEFARSMPSLSAAPSASPGTDALVEALADAEPLAVRSPAGPPSPPPLAAGARRSPQPRRLLPLYMPPAGPRPFPAYGEALDADDLLAEDEVYVPAPTRVEPSPRRRASPSPPAKASPPRRKLAVKLVVGQKPPFRVGVAVVPA